MSQNLPPQSDFPLTLAEVLSAELTEQRPDEAGPVAEQVRAALKNASTWAERKKVSADVVPDIYTAIRGLEEKRTALCLSGGGVRSAIFNLGVLQGLARAGLLNKFDYLSTVSGGGFIGGWLTAWIYREQDQHEKAVACNNRETGQSLEPEPNHGLAVAIGELTNQPPPLNPEPEPLKNLRIYANYLTPKKGLLSVDTWTLVAIYLRNLLLNWMVFVPVIMALLMLPRIWVAVLKSSHLGSDLSLDILLAIGFAGAAFALSYIGTNLPSAKLLNCSRTRFVYLCLAPLVISSMGLTSYWFRLGTGSRPEWWQFLVFAELLCIVPAVVCLIVRLVKGKWAGVIGGYTLGTSLVAFLIAALLIWYITNILKITQYFSGAYFARVYASLAVPFLLILLTVGGTFIAGFTSRKTDSDDQEWWARSGAWILIVVVSWSAFHLLVLGGPVLLVNLQGKLTHLLFAKGWAWEDIKSVGTVVAGIISGAITLLGGSSSKTPAQGDQGKPPDWKAKILSMGTSVAAVVFGAFIVIVLALITNWILASSLSEQAAKLLGAGLVSLDPNDPLRVIYDSPGRLLVVFAFVIAILGWLLGRLINTNRFSLHYYWRNRMMRAYLGVSRDKNEREETRNKFTDFDMSDNVQMYKLQRKPLHVVNVTLNLAGGEKLEWQDRKAESFSISPLHSGSYWLGYRNSKEYTDRGISLATSVAISGAAASPNMGYMMSSPVVRFLMTLFNVRLGFWLGNPGVAGGKTFHNDSPTQSVGPIFAEALGMTDDQSPYVYLSDGGHFENLGLYEMILRRCRFIVVSDASTDTEYAYESLAMAIRQIRVDFGVPIDMGKMKFDKNPDPKNNYCAVGVIRYSCMDKQPKDSKEPDANYDGVLVYLKPSLIDDEPRDVLNYHASSKTFPEETIADQWFSEPQFESYRALGNHMIATICAAAPASTSGPTATEQNAPKSTVEKGAPSIDDRIREVIEALRAQPLPECGEPAGFAARAVGHVQRGEGQSDK
jgi:Patatin-like phospholipase